MRSMMTNHDRDLGMGARITRRDFLNGVALGIGGSLVAGRISPDLDVLLAQTPNAAYPPPLTGLRGSHVGSFEALHSMRDAAFWKTAPAPQDTGEEYDLVVVGAGISGLAAAHFFRAARPDARILVLDNHDDFGGHAKRNEFTHNGRTYIGYGGTQSIDSPAPYSAVAKALITELGIDVARYAKALDSGLYKSLGLRPGVLLRQGNVRHRSARRRRRAGRRVPRRRRRSAISVKRDVKRLLTERFDPMPGLSSAEKKARLARMSYAEFVTKLWKLDPGVLRLYQTRTHGLFGVGVDAVPAQDAFGLGLPGLCRHGSRCGTGPGTELRLDPQHGGRELLLPFPGRQRLGRPPARAPTRARRHSRIDDGRRRDGAGRLLEARRRRGAGEHSSEQFRDARAPHRIRRRPTGRGRLPAETARSRP